jgi:hypothetical protein
MDKEGGNKLKEKPLISKKVLGTDKFNIKNSLSGMGKDKFYKQLNKINLEPDKYLSAVKEIAVRRNYKPELLGFSDDGIHKLIYDGIPFGRIGYNDKIIYAWLEINNKIPEGTMEIKYNNYRKRAKKVMEDTNNKFSPASLSYFLLW